MTPVSIGQNDNLDLSKLYDGLLNKLGVDPAKVDSKTLESIFAQYKNFSITDGEGPTVPGGRTNRKVNLTPPDAKKVASVDYQMLVEMLNNENVEVQAQQAKKRFQNLRDQIDASSSDKNLRLMNLAEGQESQESASFWMKLMSGGGMALSIAVAVGATVATGGGAIAAVGLVAAAFSTLSFVMDVSGGNEAMTDTIASWCVGPDCNQSEAKLKAGKIWGGIQIGVGFAVAATSFGVGLFGAAGETVNATAKVVQSVAGTASLVHGLGQTGFGIYNAHESKELGEDQAELTDLDVNFSMLSQHAEEEEEAINTIMALFEHGLNSLGDLLQSNYENVQRVAANNIQYG